MSLYSDQYGYFSVELDDFETLNAFRVKNNPHASGGASLQPQGEGPSTAETASTGVTGAYQTLTSYFGKMKGENQSSFAVNDRTLDEWLGNGEAESPHGERVEQVIENVFAEIGDVIALISKGGLGKLPHIDAPWFTPFEPKAPTLDLLISTSDGLHTALKQEDGYDLTASGVMTGPAYDLALGDLDGDGDLDVMADPAGEEGLTPFLNNGHGVFTAGPRLDHEFASDIALGDLDGDSDLDALASGTGAREVDGGGQVAGVVQALMNDGAANFTDGDFFYTDSSGGDVELGDFDRDGDLDGLANDYVNSAVVLGENDGEGHFEQRTVASVTADHGVLRAADMDDDGDLDAVIRSTEESIQFFDILENDGDANFIRHRFSSEEGGPFSEPELADLDEDGIPEILMSTGGEVLVFKAEQPFDYAPAPSIAASGRLQAVADLDADGDQDLILTSAEGVTIMENDGDGRFEKGDFIAVDNPVEVAVGYLDEPVAPNSTGDFLFS